MSGARGWFGVLVALDLLCIGLLLWLVLAVVHGLTFGQPDRTTWGEYAKLLLLVGGVPFLATAALAGLGRVLIVRGWRLAGLAVTGTPAIALSGWFFGGGFR